MFAALLDTSVLWPSLQRDFLLSLAAEGLYRPLWSTPILAELEFHETRKLVGKGEDALVENWEPLEGTFGLPDADDEHVVAAALVGGAEVIVTSNLRDFPARRIPKPVTVVSPAQFAADTVATSPDVARHAVAAMASRFFRPPLPIDQILDLIVDRYDMAAAAELIRAAT